MKFGIPENSQYLPVDIDTVSAMIKNTQKTSGEIPWYDGKKTDPWDHVEAAMGLSIGGHREAARRAYNWMAKVQLDDGSWYASYRDGVPDDRTRDTNLSAYIAVGVYHYYLISEDISFLKAMWETIRSAISFAISLQDRKSVV